MNKISKKMKRLLAILLVEVILAVNVVTSYAESADEPFTMTEAEAAQEAAKQDDAAEEVAQEPQVEETVEEQPVEEVVEEVTEETVAEEPVAEESTAEEPVAEEPVAEESATEEGTEGDVAEQPTETPAEEVTEEVPSEEVPTEEEVTEEVTCTCSEACAADAYDETCAVCAGLANLETEEEKDTYVKEHCAAYAEAVEPEETEEPETVETEVKVVEEDNSVTVIGICEVDGEVIEDVDSFEITVDGVVSLADKAPVIEGYTFAGEVTLEDGDQISQIKKETVETKEEEEVDGEMVVTQINKTTTMSYKADADWIELTEDITVVFTYTEGDEEEAEAVEFVATYVDQDGNAIDGCEDEVLTFEESLDLTKAPTTIEDYTYIEAQIDDTVVSSINMKIEETKDDEAVSSYYYITADGEEVEVTEDTVVTLVYEEDEVVVKVDASVVDEFGDEIDEAYTNMELPEFSDDVLVLNDTENPPVDKVQVRQSLFKVTKYTYVQATIDGEIVSSLKREATKDTADLKDSQKEYIYSYTSDGKTWTKIKEDTTVVFEYTDGKKTVYTYEDSQVLVTATLQHANAIPDDAEFVVTPVTADSSDYNYDAYMEALNAADEDSKNSSDSKTKKYNENNTLLYDIAFLAPEVDEDGNTIDDSLVEYQPAEGMVSISIVFKKSQISDELAATSAKEVTITHLPLTDSVKEANATTADATDISASDIKVETVNGAVSLEGGTDQASFCLSDFSVIGVSSVTGNPTSDDKLADENYTLEYVLNYYNVVAFGDVNIPGHTVGAMMVNGDLSTQAFGDAAAAPTYVKGKLTSLSNYNNTSKVMYLGSDNTIGQAGQYDTRTMVNGFYLQGSNLAFENPGYVDMSKLLTQVNNTATGMKNQSTKKIDATATSAGSSKSNPLTLTAGITQDLYLGGKTNAIYVEFEGFNANTTTPTIVNILDSGTVYIPVADSLVSGESGFNMSIVFNVPNASKVIVCDGTNSYGHVIAPQADITLAGNNYSGCIVGKNISGNSEGHMWPYDEGNGSLVIPTTSGFGAVKKVDGQTPTSGQTFTFGFDELVDGSWKNIETKQNSGEEINFSKIEYSSEGTHWYRIYEVQNSVEGFTLSTAQYIVKVVVTSSTSGSDTVYSSTITYYKVTGSDTAAVDASSLISGSSVDTSKLSSISGSSAAVFDNTTVVEETEISVKKVWEDSDNKAGFRPSYVTVQLKADGVNSGSAVTLNVDNNWSYTWTELPEKNNGQTISYTVEETSVPDKYESNVSGSSEAGYTITNSYTPETVEVSGSKIWNDNDDQDGLRPDSITIRLWADGSEVASKTVTGSDWSWNFTGLDKYKNGNEITYTITEDSVDGYTTSVNGYNVTNTHTPETVDVNGSKTWNDNGNQDGKRPTSITIRLYADGTEVDSRTVTADSNWSWSFTGLAKYNDGKEISYTISEDAVDGYTTKVEGYNVTNSYTPEKTNVSGSKTWNDANNQDGKRPGSITIRLLANGEQKATQIVTAANGWSWSFDNLDKYANGQVITYTIVEDAVADYTTTYDGYNVTNSYTPEETGMTVTKVWNDNYDQDGLRPDSVQVQLYADGEAYGAEVTLTAEMNWTYTWENLPKMNAGNTISYTVEEVGTVTGYTVGDTTYTGSTAVITNTHTPEVTSISGTKTWNDNDDQDGIRPESITINLLANGEAVDHKTVTAQTGWSYTFDNLPKKANGQTITYTITEDTVAGYTTTISGYNVTNTHTPETTEVNGSKVWKDNDNQDGLRPSEIIVNLLADGEQEKSITVKPDAEGNWTWSFTNLPKYKNVNGDGVEILYTVTENAVDGYTPAVTGDATNGYIITNTHTPGETGISVKKVWDDTDNQDGKRPESIQVQLYADGKASGDAVSLSEANNWSYSFTGLPEKSAGNTINYTVKEVAVPDGYSVSYNLDADGKMVTITNAHETEKTSVSGSKTWNDANNQDGIRPDSVTIHLFANGADTGKVAVATAANNWSWTFADLDKYADGNEIKYTITEDGIEGYNATIDGFNVTNTHEPAKTEVNGSKTWNDNNNQDGVRPASIIINLLADGEKVDSKTVTEADNWAWSFTDLDKYANGNEIVYTITEEKIEGYSSVVTGYDVTNTHTPGKTTYSVSKAWNDNNNQDGMRANSITVQLLANGTAQGTPVTLSAANGWSYTWTDLDEKSNGTVITYSVEEISAIAGYETTYQTTDNGVIITNSHTPETKEINGSKTWNDNDDQDGKRPESITITLLADGNVKEVKTVTAADGWKWSFTNLPVYADGNVINYTITESEVAGYDTEINGYDVTNTHELEKTSVEGSKLWADADNQDGKRPTSVTVNLLANGEKVDSQVVTADANGNWNFKFENLDKYADGEEIVYTVTEETVTDYTTTINGTTITNSYTPGKTSHTVNKVWEDANNQDGMRPESIQVQLYADGKAYGSEVTLDVTNNWSHTWTDLDLMSKGQTITYTVEEIGTVSGYTASEPATANGITTITNTHTPETVEVNGSKTWADAENQDGVRPESITINLFADGAFKESKTVTAAEGWAWSFTNLDKYANGKEITYTITEDAVEGYETKVSGYDVTNTHTPEKTSINGTKVWKDADNQDGKRPASITVNLVADGVETNKSVTVTAADDWKWSFTDLDKYADGEEIVYTVTENTVTDYTTDIDGYVITNSYTPGKTSHSVEKVWDDANNQDGVRPKSIHVQLYADGKAQGEVVILNATNSWSYTWEDLDLMSKGEQIVYTVQEVEVPEGYTLTESITANNKTTITNSYTPEKTSVSGSKTWVDADDQDGVRPGSIKITLYANGSKVDEKTVTEADGWAWSFTGLDKYADGQEITYTITEDAVAGYESNVNGFDVTNTHTPEKTSVNGEKTWDDADNQDGVRPESITIKLLANGETIQSKVVTEADGWMWTFDNLDKYENGTEIVYTITEEISSKYSVKIDGMDITNSYTPGKTSLNVKKVWVDADNQDGIRPATIKVQLYADGKAVDGMTTELNAANGWEYTWTDLDERKEGQIITYTAEEIEVPSGYEVSYNNETTGTTIITNTHTPDEITVSGSKTWDDNDNQDGKRPASITINLLANGEVVRTQTVAADEEGNWTWTFTNLPKKANGQDITYTVTEEAVEGYTTVVDGYNVTNTHTPEKTEVNGSKTWVDNNDAEHARPESITINLYADSKLKESKTVTAAEDWAWSFTDLDKYADGKEITYTITEDYVYGYSTEVNGYDVTNTYTPDVTSITVTKVWEDNNNQDGKRSETIVVQLYEKFGIFDLARGEAVELSADNNWSYTWTDLPVKKQNDEVKYTVREISKIAGYETEIINGTNITITNTNTPETTEVEGEKVWEDNNDQDGKRPDSITVRLFDGETEVAAQTVTAENNWKFSFTNLPKYKNGGEEIVYTVREDAVSEYTTEITGTAKAGFTVTNTHTPDQTEYKVKKVWVDANNQDGIRPETITVQLYANGEAVEGKSAVLNTENAWTYTWTELDKMNGGKEIVYTAQETSVPEGYTMTEDNSTAGITTITNTHEPATVEVSGSKTWADADNQDGVRPASITIRLYADGAEVGVKEVTAADNWAWSFTNLPQKEAGKDIVYTITEDAVDGYETVVDDYDVTNTHTPEKTSLSGEKVWDDANNQDGERPESIIVNLFANGKKVQSKEVTAADNWKWSFDNLDKFKAGEEIVYAVTEDAVSKYTTVIEGTTITNSYTPGKTSHSVEKIWSDASDQDGIRPESITVDLYADGVKMADKSVELNAGNNWKYTWTDLDEKKDGQTITYTAKEAAAVTGYETTYNNESTGTTIITNTHTPELTEISGSKVWDDNDNQDGKRPESITVKLLADDKEVASQVVAAAEDGTWTWSFTELPMYRDGGTEIVYTFSEAVVTGYTSTVEGTVITNTHEIEKTRVDGKKTWVDNNDAEGARPESITINLLANGTKVDERTVTAEDNWTWSFTDLDKYADGKEISYTITEEAVLNYSTEVNGYDVTNTFTPGKTSISVTKIWDDNNDQDGIRPEKITVQLYEEFGPIGVATRETVELSAANNWSYTWTDLPDKASIIDGQEVKVKYFVKEVGNIAGYTTTVSDNDQSTQFEITNTHETETVEVEGMKVWSDADNQDDVRPESITVRLLANGDEVAAKTVTAENNWKFSFTDLPKYENGGQEIVYTVEEDGVAEYVTEITGDAKNGFTITNTHETYDTEYSVEKIWDDANNQDGIRPTSITVQLYADGVAVEGKIAVLNLENAWKYTWTGLDKMSDGELIVYTAQEVTVPNKYEAETEHDAANAVTTITNSYTPEVVSVEGAKTWNDADNQDGIRPEAITINLLADGTVVGTKTVTAADGWKWSFTNLPKNEDQGTAIVYTISEEAVEGYETEVKGYDVTNTHTPEKTSISGSKVWDDADDQDGFRPESITINLHADGVKTQSKVVTADDNWMWTFDNLDKYADGKEIVYTFTEEKVQKYTTTYSDDTLTITNSYTPGKVSHSVEKIWNDADDQDGFRPESITVDLYADGVKVEGKSVELNAGNNWRYTWTDLDEKKAGQIIDYTAVEATELADYTVVHNNDVTGITTITNTHVPEEVEVEGAKTWVDADDQDGKRPESITIRLYADGEEVDSQTVTADAEGNWTWKFTKLPKRADGEEITYTVTEDAVAEYETTVDGYNVTNTHTPEKVTIEGSKTWVDNDNAENVRPESITVRLYANSEEIDSLTVTPDASGNWTWKFENLDKYADGKLINYTISEDKVIDYTTEVDGYDITNTYNPGRTEITVTKVWDDSDDQDGIRERSITVQLKEKTSFFTSQNRGDAVELNAANNWTYTWKNLPDTKMDEKVQYFVEEISGIEGYETVINNGTVNITITNCHDTETTEVNGTKVWADNDNQDGIRPASITIRLLADGQEVANKTVTAEDKWTWSFTELPKYRDGGIEIAYTVTEDVIADYTTEITGTAKDGYTVTNTHEPFDTEYSVEKIWDDADNQDGIRPESIIVQLHANGVALDGMTAALNTENAWKYTWTGLDTRENGVDIVYTAQEVSVPEGYTMKAEHSTASATSVITNTHTPDVVNVSGSKTWNDADNQDGLRPAGIIIRLLADGVEVDSKLVTEADGWAWNFTNLPKNAGGEEIEYTVTEDAVKGYTTEISGYDVENTHVPATVEVGGSKNWDDADNQDGKRTVSVTITLYADGEPVDSKTVTEADGWKWNFTDLPKYKDQGTPIVYTIGETRVTDYTTTYNGYDVTNSYTPGKTSITVTKAWDDANNQDGIRPVSIQVQLLANGAKQGDPITLDSANGWTYTWTELDLMSQGKEISYTVQEILEKDSKYTSTITGTAATGYTITNSYKPETVEVNGEKTWADANNHDGKRPATITINLYADGELIDSRNVTAADEWKWSFTELPKYKDQGTEIVYTITEDEVTDYVSEVNGYDVTNTHEPELTEVSGVKTWDDNDNAEGVRPEEITINLYADNELVDSKTVTEADGWKWSFTELPKYKNVNDTCVEVVYTITEDEVLDYSTTYDGYNVNNKYTPDETAITVQKVWDDADNQDGIRPESIIVQLYAGVFARGEAVVLSETNNWTYTWENLPKSKFGVDVNYHVEEVQNTAGYEMTSTLDGTLTRITNTHIPEVVEVKGIKTWDDNDNQDGIRPESITINLYADGVLVESKKVTEADGWEWSFTDLPKNKNVNGVVSEIVYTITEDAVEGYETTIEEGSYDVTNVHVPEVIEIDGSKTWDDADNQDGVRPESITIRLFADGEEIESKVVTEADGWTWKFTDLPKFKAGTEITYTITEDVVAEYSTTYDGYDVTNTHTPGETSRTVVKVWKDQNNKDGIRPKSITVQLYADGEAYGEPVVLSKANGWTYTWLQLPEKSAGQTIVYTVVEISRIKGYVTTYSADGFTITNKHTVEEPTPTPDEPTPTPDEPSDETTPTPDQPTPTPDEQVLGAKRVDDGGAVLGARRGPDYAVLGKRRRPQTGDSLAIFVWMMALAASIGGAITSVVMMKHNKKDSNK